MKLRRSTGMVAGLLSLGLLAAGPAYAAPASVSVRVEGTSKTLIPRSGVTTLAAPFSKDGDPSHTCSGTSAGGALERAAAGDWGGSYFDGFGYSLETIKGERHTFDSPQTWSFWVNYKLATAGLCDVELQQGDDVLFYAQTQASPEGPLQLIVPATAVPGRPAEIKVRESAITRVNFMDTVAERPAKGATVTAGGHTATTDAAGVVRVTLPAGPTAVQATKPGFIRSAVGSLCASTGADGVCGTPDTTAPSARIRKAYDGWYYSRRHAPRTLRGTVSSDPSGIREVQVRFKQRRGKRCASYSAAKERWVARSCKRNASWFSVGDRERWSYLLPARLRSGKYTLEVRATDKAGNRSARKRGRSLVVFRVL